MSGIDASAPAVNTGVDPLAALRGRFAQGGRVQWIGLRPARDVPMQVVAEAQAITGAGLVGDRYANASGKRGITLIQAEHLPAVAALVGRERIDPALVRRNVVVTGCNLLALIGRRFRLGSVLLEGTDICAPCARMEAALGNGGYSAMLGHGGITTRVLDGGVIALGDALQLLTEADPA